MAIKRSTALQRVNPPRDVVFQPLESEDERHLEYVIDTAALGPQSLYWVASWCEGFFSLADIVGYTPLLPSLSSLASTVAGVGMVHEDLWKGEDLTPFCTALWEYLRERTEGSPATPAATLFSQRLLSTLLPEGWRGAILQHAADSAELNRWWALYQALPFWRKQVLALPA